MDKMKLVVGLAGLAMNNYGSKKANLTDLQRVSYLNSLIDQNVMHFDAAHSYGNIHTLLSKISKHFLLDTKINNDPAKKIGPQIEQIISLKETFADKLNIVYLHNVGGRYMKAGWFNEFFNELKKHIQNLRIGVSVYTKEDLLFFSPFEQINTVQVPASIFDISNVIYAKKLRKDWSVVVRSIFLRGYIFNPEMFVKDVLSVDAGKEFIRDYKDMIMQTECPLDSLTVSYFKHRLEVDSFIVGSRSVERIIEYNNIFDSSLSDNIYFNNITERKFTNARTWRI